MEPIRLDPADRPPRKEERPDVTAAAGADAVRQLGSMNTTRRCNPMEDSSGSLRRVLSRLQLHLSIGEAF